MDLIAGAARATCGSWREIGDWEDGIIEGMEEKVSDDWMVKGGTEITMEEVREFQSSIRESTVSIPWFLLRISRLWDDVVKDWD
jgi:heptaprenylglyceryl phosphate synthase